MQSNDDPIMVTAIARIAITVNKNVTNIVFIFYFVIESMLNTQ